MFPRRENIHFVLVRTQFASNLGSSVRVMKNMGFEHLILVQPECEVGLEARSYAMKGAPVLDRARFVPTLDEVADELGLLIGTTGRYRGRKPRMLSCRTLVEDLLPKFASSKIGIVLGSEDNGLRREELRLCQWLVEIPTGSDYQVLNLAQAAAIVAYEIHVGMSSHVGGETLHEADSKEVESLMSRIEEALNLLDLPTRLSVGRLMLRLRKITGRAQLEREDVNMLHGLVKELSRKIGRLTTKAPRTPR